MSVDFTPIAFQAAIAIDTILFAGFAVLVSMYSVYTATGDPRDIPPIVPMIRNLCKAVALTGLVTAFLTGYSLYEMSLHRAGDIFLAVCFGVLAWGIAVFMAWWAFVVR